MTRSIDRGYRVTGEWGFASGSKHAAWLCGHGTICAPSGEPRLGPDGKPPDLLTVLFPKSSATMIDVWNVMGLKGTGSDNYSVQDLFVPANYSFTREADADRREQGPLYRFSIFKFPPAPPRRRLPGRPAASAPEPNSASGARTQLYSRHSGRRDARPIRIPRSCRASVPGLLGEGLGWTSMTSAEQPAVWTWVRSQCSPLSKEKYQ